MILIWKQKKNHCKEVEVLGGKFDKNNYTTERLWATAEDGMKIPISVVYRKGIKRRHQLLLYGRSYVQRLILIFIRAIELLIADLFLQLRMFEEENIWEDNGMKRKLLFKKYIYRFYRRF